MWRSQFVRVVYVVLVAFAVDGAGCGSESDQSVTPPDRSGIVDGCNLDPGANHGELPGCAAGVSGPNGPGVPADFVGQISESVPRTAAEQAGTAAANQRDVANAGRPLVDRGIPPQGSDMPHGGGL